jgi:hypothetical protein
MHRRHLLAATTALGLGAGAARAQTATAPAAGAGAPIGTARMEPDGTIVLMLVASGPGGAIGQGLMRYPPNDPNYAAVLRHVGPLRPGEERPVPPWPDAR